MSPLSSKQLWILAGVSLVLGLLFNLFFFDKAWGISFPIYVFLLVGALYCLFGYFKLPFNKQALWYLVPLLFFSGMDAVRASRFLMNWNFLVTLGLLILFVAHNLGNSVKDFQLLDYLRTAVSVPLSILAKMFNAAGRLLATARRKEESKRSSQIAKGIIITLPIFILFVLLLSSADAVFGKLISNIFDFNLNFPYDPNLVPKFWWMLIFAFIWLGAGAYVLEDAHVRVKQPEPTSGHKSKFGGIETGILLGSLNFLFLVFVIIQIKYLFAGHSAISVFDLTYAEYAHKGFAELILVSVITFLLVFGLDKYIERENDKHPFFFKFMSGLMIALVLVIMASAFARLTTYEQAYGFTLLRIFVQGFIIWLAAVFVWLAYKIFSQLAENHFAFGAFLLVLIFFVALNLMNPEAFIVKKNIDQFARANKLDTEQFYSLSADGVPQLFRLFDYPSAVDKDGQALPNKAASLLLSQKSAIEKYSQLWQSYNSSRSKAQQLINQNLDQIKALSGNETIN